MTELILVDPTLVHRRGNVAGAFGDPRQTMQEGYEFVWGAIQHCLNMPTSSHDQYYWFPIKIFHVKAQVVSGMMYVYSVLVGESTYTRKQMKPDDIPKHHCTLREGGRRAIYQVNVWLKPGRDRRKEYRIQLLRDVPPDEEF